MSVVSTHYVLRKAHPPPPLTPSGETSRLLLVGGGKSSLHSHIPLYVSKPNNCEQSEYSLLMLLLSLGLTKKVIHNEHLLLAHLI